MKRLIAILFLLLLFSATSAVNFIAVDEKTVIVKCDAEEDSEQPKEGKKLLKEIIPATLSRVAYRSDAASWRLEYGKTDIIFPTIDKQTQPPDCSC